MKIEHVRMRIAHEQISTDLIDLELIELKFIFNRRTFDLLFAFYYDNIDSYFISGSSSR